MHIVKDLAVGVTVVGLMVGSTAIAIPPPDKAPPEKAEKVSTSSAVKELAFRPSQQGTRITLGGKNKVTSIEDAEALEKLLGEADAKTLAEKVNFKTENVVLVSWIGSGGRGEGLEHKVVGAGADKTVVFSVRPPDSEVIRLRAMLGSNFFVVPKDLKVAFDKGKARGRGNGIERQPAIRR